MATQPHKTRDASPGEEIVSTTIPPPTSSPPPKSNAFADLMSPKKPPSKPPKQPPSKPTKQPHHSTPATDPARSTTFLGRDGLGAYIHSPESFPASRVIYHDEKWVVINDLFPKSSVHILLLRRNPEKQFLHPFEAFEDLEFLKEAQEQVSKMRTLVAKELQRRYGKFSTQDQTRQKAIDATDSQQNPPDPTNLPPGRDWSQSVISGIHAGPSMNHLHIHILSTDRHSECMRHRKHYNSFSTPFLVGVEEFPLGKGDGRRRAAREGYLERELKCWRCGRGFGKGFKRLKEHLGEEFEVWKRE